MSQGAALELLGVPVRLVTEDGPLAERLEVCYRLDPARGPVAGERAVRGAIAAEDGAWRVDVAGRASRLEADREAALRALNHELLHALMRRAPGLFYVHAAVVSFGDAGVVLPGLSRAGKSTLALACVERGAGFLSDELLAYDPDRREARAFHRAIKIRDECVDYFPELSARFLGRGEARFLPFPALPSGALRESVPVRAIVAPRWESGGGTRLAETTPGTALLELARSALNFGTHRQRSPELLAELARGARGFELVWDDPRVAAELLCAELAGA